MVARGSTFMATKAPASEDDTSDDAAATEEVATADDAESKESTAE